MCIRDSHNIADDRAGWDLWGAKLDQFLKGLEARHQEADLLASSDASSATKIAAEGRDTPSTPASLVVPAAE